MASWNFKSKDKCPPAPFVYNHTLCMTILHLLKINIQSLEIGAIVNSLSFWMTTSEIATPNLPKIAV